jgi:hypothetical protein
MIAFLEALVAMPLHEAPETFTNTTDLEEVESISLWPRGVIETDTFRVHVATKSTCRNNHVLKRPSHFVDAEIDCVGSGLEIWIVRLLCVGKITNPP